MEIITPSDGFYNLEETEIENGEINIYDKVGAFEIFLEGDELKELIKQGHVSRKIEPGMEYHPYDTNFYIESDLSPVSPIRHGPDGNKYENVMEAFEESVNLMEMYLSGDFSMDEILSTINTTKIRNTYNFYNEVQESYEYE